VTSGAEAWPSDGNFNSRETDGNFFWNFFSVGYTVFDMQADGVFDVLYRLFVAVSLTVATLKCGARNKIAVGVGFDDDRKS
jgi:hypothetical protein